MGRDDELCILEAAESVVNEDEEGQLALRGEGGFGFVEEEEAVAGEFAFEEGEEGLAVRAGVQALAAIAGKNPRTEDLFVQFIDGGGGVEEAFCTQEKACAGSCVEGEAEGADQGIGGVIVLGGVMLEIAVAALGAEAVMPSDSFKECGFS